MVCVRSENMLHLRLQLHFMVQFHIAKLQQAYDQSWKCSVLANPGKQIFLMNATSEYKRRLFILS